MLKILLINDFLGNFCWFGGISCGVRGDARIMKELGPPLHRVKPGEAHLLDGGFGGRRGSITKGHETSWFRFRFRFGLGFGFIILRLVTYVC